MSNCNSCAYLNRSTYYYDISIEVVAPRPHMGPEYTTQVLAPDPFTAFQVFLVDHKHLYQHHDAPLVIRVHLPNAQSWNVQFYLSRG